MKKNIVVLLIICFLFAGCQYMVPVDWDDDECGTWDTWPCRDDRDNQ
jgi:hypothetical protein